MNLLSFSLFAVASSFTIAPSNLHLRPTTWTNSKYLRRHSDGISLFYTKASHLLSRNESTVQDGFVSDIDIEMPGSPVFLHNEEADALFASLDQKGKVHHIDGLNNENKIMRPPPDITWDGIKRQLMSNFGFDNQALAKIDEDTETKESLLSIYKSMQLARQFEAACNKQYMQGKIRGFMHLDNGQ